MALTHSQRGSIGADTIHAQGKTNTRPARAAWLRKFEREVDPRGELNPAERARRAEYARRAYMTRLSAKGVAARQAKTGT